MTRSAKIKGNLQQAVHINTIESGDQGDFQESFKTAFPTFLAMQFNIKCL